MATFHDDFKIISNGKELSYPYLRLVASWAMFFGAGMIAMSFWR